MDSEKLTEFFRTECDYTSLLEQIIAAQSQLLFVQEKIDLLPEHEQPATDHITDLFFTLGRLVPLLNPAK